MYKIVIFAFCIVFEFYFLFFLFFIKFNYILFYCVLLHFAASGSAPTSATAGYGRHKF